MNTLPDLSITQPVQARVLPGRFFELSGGLRYAIHPATTAFFPPRSMAARAAHGMMRALFKHVFDTQGVQ